MHIYNMETNTTCLNILRKKHDKTPISLLQTCFTTIGAIDSISLLYIVNISRSYLYDRLADNSD